MRNFSQKLISIILCVMITAALTACQESGVFINNDENGSYTLSDQISLSSTVLRSINPITSQDEDFYHVTKLVYESLVELDDTLMPKPMLAESWNIDSESKKAEFTLRNDVKFSDGGKLTASDVVFSFNACKASSTSPYRHCVDHISGAVAEGDNKVVFNFLSSTNISPSDFTFPIVSAGQFISQSDFLSKNDEIISGTGPYKITSADLKDKLVLEPSQTYRGTKPANTISFMISPVETPFNGFVESGDLDMIIDKSTDREDISGNEKLKVTDFTSNEFETLGFNCASGPCADSNIRRAIAFIVDRDAIKRSAYYNSGIKSDDLYYPGYYGTEIKNLYTPDTEAAAECLGDAGYIDTDGDGIVEGADGTKLNLRILINADNLSRKTAADMIVQQLFEGGIIASVTEVATENFLSSVNSGAYDMFIGGWKVSEEYDLRSFYHSAYGNPAAYSNAVLDSYLDKMRSGISGEEMTEVLGRVKEIIEGDMPYLCLMYKTYAVIHTSNLDGLVAPRFNNYYYACEDWHIRIYQDTEEEETENENSEGAEDAD